MTIRDRAYNVIKALKKVWFEEYCDVQKAIEVEFGPLVDALHYIQSAGQGGNCLVCGEEDTCTENCAVGKALKGK